MSDFDRIEPRLSGILADLAAPRAADYIDDLVRRTATTPQRPAWTFFERWLPMSALTIATTRRAVPWRTIAAVMLAVLLAAGIVLIGTGQLRPPLPAPFGRAGAGQVLYEAGGDILAVDPETGSNTQLVAGPADDRQPRWSPDGSRFAFRRVTPGDRATVLVAAADGSGVTEVTPQPLDDVADHLFSPDGRSLAITSSSPLGQVITIVDLDDGSTRRIEAAGGASLPSFSPPDGADILFVTGARWSTEGQGLAAYDVVSGAIRTIVEPIPNGEIVGRPEYSPDGEHLAFAVWIPVTNTNSYVVTANADGSDQRPLPQPPGLCCEAMPSWSNDGTRLAVTRWYEEPHEVIAVVPWDRGGLGQEFAIPGMYRGIASWSPDDAWILVTPQRDEHGIDRSPQVLLDLATGRAREIGWTTTSDPTIQRLAQ